MTIARIRLYTRDGCHLCDEARGVLELVCAEMGEVFEERDVDADPLDHARFSDLVPVVQVDGTVISHWRVEAAHLRAVLHSPLVQ